LWAALSSASDSGFAPLIHREAFGLAPEVPMVSIPSADDPRALPHGHLTSLNRENGSGFAQPSLASLVSGFASFLLLPIHQCMPNSPQSKRLLEDGGERRALWAKEEGIGQYGDGTASTGSCVPSPNFFTGKERDAETGNDYFGARYYNSTAGRWMIRDWSTSPVPVPYSEIMSPQTLNLYQYVGGNPIGRRDLDGHMFFFGIGSCSVPPPPPPPKPPSPPASVFDDAHVNKLTVRQVANVVANENDDVMPGDAGPEQLQEAKTAQANGVMNGDKKYGDSRDKRAGTAPKTDPKVSQEQKDQALEAARTAFTQQAMGTDPTGGRIFFNNRFTDDSGPRQMGTQKVNVF
jgi:RHS repeat-associated protein